MKKTLVLLAGILVLASVGLWCLQADDRNGVASLKDDSGATASSVKWIPVRENPKEGLRVIELHSSEVTGDPGSLTGVPGVVGVLYVRTTAYLVQGPLRSAADFQLCQISDQLEQTGKDRNSVVPLAAQPAAHVRPIVARTVADSPHTNVPRHMSVPLPLDANIRGGLRHLGYDY